MVLTALTRLYFPHPWLEKGLDVVWISDVETSGGRSCRQLHYCCVLLRAGTVPSARGTPGASWPGDIYEHVG